MALKIAIINQKGGVGKSSTVHTLADNFRKLGRVLILDMDQQNNQATLLNVRDKISKEASIAGVLISGYDPKKCAINAYPNVDLIHSGGRTIENFDRFSKEPIESSSTILSRAMIDIEKDYEYILMDTSPSMTLIHQNIICYADYIIIPCDMDLLSLSASRSVVHFITALRSKISSAKAEILGILPVKYDKRRSVDELIMSDLLSLSENDLIEGAVIFPSITDSANMKTTHVRRKFLSEAFPKAKITEDFSRVALLIIEETAKRSKTDQSQSFLINKGLLPDTEIAPQ
jgi:chromosome partitioning protein